MAEAHELSDLREKRQKWLFNFRLWQGIAWGLLVSIAGGSAFVASSWSGAIGMKDQSALLVAVASALLVALRPEMRAQAMRKAYIEIDLAIKREEGVSAELIDALQRSESFIEAGYFPSDARSKASPATPISN